MNLEKLSEIESRLKIVETSLNVQPKKIKTDKASVGWDIPEELRDLVHMTSKGPVISSGNISSIGSKEALGIFLLCSKDQTNKPAIFAKCSKDSGVPVANASRTLGRDLKGIAFKYGKGFWKLSNPKWVFDEAIPKLRGGNTTNE